MATGNRKDTNLNSLTIEEIDLKVKADVEAMLKVDIGDSKKAEQGNYVFFGFAGSKKFDITSFEIKENKFGIYAGGDVNTNSKIKSINYTLLKDSVHDNTIYYFDKFGIKYTKNIDYFYDYHLHLLPYNTKSFFIDKCFGCFMQIIFTKSGLWIQTLEKKLLILEINLGDVVINKFGMPENFYKFNIYSSNVKEIKSVDTYIYLYCSNDNLWIYHYEETTNMFSGDSQSYGYYKLSIQDFERGHKASVVHKSKSSITPSLENPLAIFKNKKTSKQ